MLTLEIFTFSPIRENTYILHNEKNECIVVDPGCYFDEEKQFLKQWIEVRGMEVKLLLNTHGHLDHVFGNKFVAETWGLQPWLHPAEEQVYKMAPASGLMWQLPFELYTGPMNWLQEGTDVVFGTDRLQVLFTPGHSPGSVSFYHAEQGFVIGGDVLFHEGIGRTDLPGGRLDVLLNSIRTQLFTLPDETVVYPGHGEPTTVGYEKKHNPFLNR
ncbi:MAG: MBL fold metallo-hydrolase [Chitinophagaceae bacterium]